MARPAGNAARPSAGTALRTLPRAPGLTEAQAQVYRRYGKLLVDAGVLAATDVPMLEGAARTRATLDALYGDPKASRATIAAFERLHKEQLIQLGLTPAARRAVQRLDAPGDPAAERVKGLLE